MHLYIKKNWEKKNMSNHNKSWTVAPMFNVYHKVSNTECWNKWGSLILGAIDHLCLALYKLNLSQNHLILFSKSVLIPSLLRAVNLQCLSFYSRSWPRSVDSCCPALVWNCRTWRSARRACLTVKTGVDETAKENGVSKISKSME